MRAQSAVEFLTTYSWAFLMLGIFVATIVVFYFTPNQGVETYIPESCYIGPSLPCYQSLMLTNTIASTSTFIVILQNNLGVPISFLSTNSIQVFPSYYQNSSYLGNCIPQNAISGSTVICNATYSSVTTPGTQQNPRFILNYRICGNSCSKKIYSTVYNTSGASVTVAAPYKSLIFTIALGTNHGGQMAVSGVKYSNGGNVIFISGLNYNIYAATPTGFTFNSWIPSSNVLVGNVLTQSTYASANGVGTLTATFH